MNFCTIADKNYLTKALALYKSLTETCDDFTLHFLCIDFETYRKAAILKVDGLLKNVELYDLNYLEEINAELQKAKENPAAKYGTQYSQYCWTLTPWFTNYILKTIPENEYLLYIDADIYLYGSPQIILDEMNNASVGIHTHRFGGEFRETDVGWYNCGIVVFRNDLSGNFLSDEWKELLLSPVNKYAEKYGTCGDQKYLEVIKQYGGDDISVFDKNILHGAPWCCSDLKNKFILWYHFSHFNYNESGYKDHTNNPPEWMPIRHGWIKPLYDNYYKVIMKMEKLIG